jgi:hypothetical protein
MSDAKVAVKENSIAKEIGDSGGLHSVVFFTQGGDPSFRSQVEWELRTAVISNEKGEKIFEQKNVEIPKSWSMTATNVVVSKYFHGPDQYGGTGDQRPPDRRPCRTIDGCMGPQAEIFRHGTGC